MPGSPRKKQKLSHPTYEEELVSRDSRSPAPSLSGDESEDELPGRTVLGNWRLRRVDKSGRARDVDNEASRHHREYLDQIAIFGGKGKVLLKGWDDDVRDFRGRKKGGTVRFFLESVSLQLEGEQLWILCNAYESKTEDGKLHTKSTIWLAPEDECPVADNLNRGVDGEWDRGVLALEAIIQTALECHHSSTTGDHCRRTCYEPLCKEIDKCFEPLSKSSDAKRAAELYVFHLVEAAVTDHGAGYFARKQVVQLFMRDLERGKHTVSPVLQALACEVDLFQHSLRCPRPIQTAFTPGTESSRAPLPPDTPPLPPSRDRGVRFPDHATRIFDTGGRIVFVHDKLQVDVGNQRCGDIWQDVGIRDFVGIDGEDGQTWIGRIHALRAEGGKGTAHVQWFVRQDALAMFQRGQHLSNELFAQPSCDDIDISAINGKIDVTMLPLDQYDVPEDVKGWVVRFAYDDTANGRIRPFDGNQKVSWRGHEGDYCPACVEKRYSVDQNGEEDGFPYAEAGTGDVLMEWRGRKIHAGDYLAYGHLDQAEVVRIEAFDDQHDFGDGAGPRQAVRVRRFARVNMFSDELQDQPWRAASGAVISYPQTERELVHVPSKKKIWLPLLETAQGAGKKEEWRIQLGRDPLIVVPAEQFGPRRALPALTPPLPADFYVALNLNTSPLSATGEELKIKPNVIESLFTTKFDQLKPADREAVRLAFRQAKPNELDAVMRVNAACNHASERQQLIDDRAEFIHAIRRPPRTGAQVPKITILDLFAGCGGTAIGLAAAFGAYPLNPGEAEVYKAFQSQRDAGIPRDQCSRAPYSELLTLVGVDMDLMAMATYEKNTVFGRPHHRNVDELLEDLIKHRRQTLETMLPPDRNIDIICLTPPCQGYANVNAIRRSVNDHRSALIATGLSFVELLKPRIVFIEEVPGMANIEDNIVYRWLIRTLVKLGYSVDSGVRCASDFGLPQTRKRFLVLATRRDCAKQCLLPEARFDRSGTNGASQSFKIPILGRVDVTLDDNGEPKPLIAHETQDIYAHRNHGLYAAIDDLCPFNWYRKDAFSTDPAQRKIVPAKPTSRTADFDGDGEKRGEYAAHAPRWDKVYGGAAERKVTGWTTIDYRRPPANDLQLYYRTHHLFKDEILEECVDHVTEAPSQAFLDEAYLAFPDAFNEPRVTHQLNERQRQDLEAERKGATSNAMMTKTRRSDNLVGGTQRRTQFTVRERARLQGFPDSFTFPDGASVAERNKLIGNSVSPFMSFYVGLEMLDTLVADWKRQRP